MIKNERQIKDYAGQDQTRDYLFLTFKQCEYNYYLKTGKAENDSLQIILHNQRIFLCQLGQASFQA